MKDAAIAFYRATIYNIAICLISLGILACVTLFPVLVGPARSAWIIRLIWNYVVYAVFGPGLAGWITYIECTSETARKPRTKHSLGAEILANIVYVVYFTILWMRLKVLVESTIPDI